MKYILILLTTLLVTSANAQKSGIQVSAPNKTIVVNLLDEDVTKIISINSTLKSVASGKLSVVNNNWKKETEWKRSFSIYNEKDESIVDLKPCKTSGKYEASLKSLLSKMNKGETYSLYTMAIPRDPKKAAVVRVRRVFVCRISIA